MDRLSGEESRLEFAELEVASDFRRADQLEITSRNASQYDQARWAQRRKVTIAEEDVLSFLSRKAVISKYGFPVDVVELDTQRTGTQRGYDVTLARDLTIAIGEFAPSATLVAGKREWQSYGLKKVPEREWERKKYKVCHRHNLMVAWNEEQSPPPLLCGDVVPELTYVIQNLASSLRRSRQSCRRDVRHVYSRRVLISSTLPVPSAAKFTLMGRTVRS